MSERIAAYLASLFAAVVAGALAGLLLGAPGWAIYAIALLSFAIYRNDDRVAGKR